MAQFRSIGAVTISCMTPWFLTYLGYLFKSVASLLVCICSLWCIGLLLGIVCAYLYHFGPDDYRVIGDWSGFFWLDWLVRAWFVLFLLFCTLLAVLYCYLGGCSAVYHFMVHIQGLCFFADLAYSLLAMWYFLLLLLSSLPSRVVLPGCRGGWSV